MEFYISEKIYIKNTEKKGIGVFAKSEIKKGEIIEISPSIPMGNKTGNKFTDPFHNYKFVYPRNYNSDNLEYVVCLGYGSLYNHSNNPNCDWKTLENHIFQFYTLVDVNLGDELCLYYGGSDYWNFDRKDIKLI